MLKVVVFCDFVLSIDKKNPIPCIVLLAILKNGMYVNVYVSEIYNWVISHFQLVIAEHNQ